jgi:hypothetical protein
MAMPPEAQGYIHLRNSKQKIGALSTQLHWLWGTEQGKKVVHSATRSQWDMACVGQEADSGRPTAGGRQREADSGRLRGDDTQSLRVLHMAD